MRRTLAVVVFASMLVAAGCQDQQARDQNARLQAELELMKSQRSGGGNDDLIKAMLLNNQKSADGDVLERKLNSWGEDTRAGLEDIKKQITASDRATDKRIDDLETRLKRVSDLESGIASLKAAIDAMESKVKNVDPNEVLNAHRDLINKEAELASEKKAKEAAQAEVANLKAQLETAVAALEAAREEMVGLIGEDISKHPMYESLRRDNRALEVENKKLQADLADIRRAYEALEEQLRKGANPPPATPGPKLENYDFSGTVTTVTRGARADGPSYLLVGSIKGTVPAVGTELTALDTRGNIVCRVKVIRHYHFNDKTDLPVEEVGCQTIDESTTKPVAKGDSVVWIKDGAKVDPKQGQNDGGANQPRAAGGGN